jgi:hypothetical protein
LRHKTIEKWDGHLPKVTGAGNSIINFDNVTK